MSRPLAWEHITPAAEEGTKVVAEGCVGDSQNVGAPPEATSVQCSDQAPVALKAAATYKQWSLDSKVYALEVLDKVMPASARRKCFPAGDLWSWPPISLACARHRY
jgi:hypothetical protein